MKVVDYKNVEILRKEHVVLKNVNLEVEEGEFIYCLLYTSPSPRD